MSSDMKRRASLCSNTGSTEAAPSAEGGAKLSRVHAYGCALPPGLVSSVCSSSLRKVASVLRPSDVSVRQHATDMRLITAGSAAASVRGSYPVWDDFISKASKLQSQLRTTVVAVAAFLDAFQKVADLATNSRAALVPQPTSTSVRVEWLLRECDG
ncbi:hypothetical protein PAMA_011962 [Pampus argenteus]